MYEYCTTTFKKCLSSLRKSLEGHVPNDCCWCRGAKLRGNQSLVCHTQEAQACIIHVVMKSSHREMQIVSEN